MAEASKPAHPRSGKKHPILFWIGIAALIVVVALAVTFEILLHRIEPVLRARVVQTLSTRFKSRVELRRFQVSLFRGFEVSGDDLEIYPYNLSTSTPAFSVDHFSFRSDYANLLRVPMHVGHVDLRGMHIYLPPKSQRKQLAVTGSGTGSGQNLKISVGEIRCTNAVLVLGTDKPGKLPLEFLIQRLVLKSVAAGKPMDFVATLVNPKPKGDIQSNGHFGPWDSDNPGNTAVGGDYSFEHADLGTLHGIGGILSSTGRYQGTLDNIVVDGQTDTPDFEVKISGHKVPLHTEFHAIVDGTDGNTYLQPVRAQFLHSSLTATGYVVRAVGEPGRHIYLDVAVDQANIQDLLELGVRSDPPIMNGQVKLHTKLDLPPGQQDVANRLKLHGHFEILNAHFTNQKVQSAVDELSLRGQGKPELAKQEAKDPQTANVGSQMQGDFNLATGLLTIQNLVYNVPGATVGLNGVYSLDGNKFDFCGTVRLQATLSQIVGGWKGLLVKPFDRFLEKSGAGTQIPIKITGTRSEPHFGLDLHHDDAQELKKKEQQRQ